jgi:hypothetical protein
MANVSASKRLTDMVDGITCSRIVHQTIEWTEDLHFQTGVLGALYDLLLMLSISAMLKRLYIFMEYRSHSFDQSICTAS